MPVLKCPVCNSGNGMPIFQKSGISIYGLQRHHDRASAINAATGNVNYRFCKDCTFTFNQEFDPSVIDYVVDYESSRGHSAYFNSYLDSVCKDINEFFPVTDKTVVEVGCGDGQFLMSLRNMFPFRGWGFDPSLDKTGRALSQDGLTFVDGYYDSQYVGARPGLLVLRHTLEHQSDVHDFLSSLLSQQQHLPERIYIEVPTWEWIVARDQVYAFNYGHCSYFSSTSLQLALDSHGFERERLSFSFDDEYLQYYGAHQAAPSDAGRNRLPSRSNSEPADRLVEQTASFVARIPEILGRLASYFADYPDAVLWGAAGKGTTLLNILDISWEQFPYVVDSNPRRHDTFIPVTGQQVVAPDTLKQIQPKFVFVTNPSYIPEIRAQLSGMGVRADLIAIK